MRYLFTKFHTCFIVLRWWTHLDKTYKISLTRFFFATALILLMITLFSSKITWRLLFIVIIFEIASYTKIWKVKIQWLWTPFKIPPPIDDHQSVLIYHWTTIKQALLDINAWNLMDKSGRNWGLVVWGVVGLQKT